MDPLSERHEQEIVTMHNLFALVAVVLLSGCNTVDSVIGGTKGIIGGVASDVVGVTAGTLDVVSGILKVLLKKLALKLALKRFKF